MHCVRVAQSYRDACFNITLCRLHKIISSYICLCNIARWIAVTYPV